MCRQAPGSPGDGELRAGVAVRGSSGGRELVRAPVEWAILSVRPGMVPRVAVYGAARMWSGLRKRRDAVELDDCIDRAGGGVVHHAGVFRVRPCAFDAHFRARRGASEKQRDDTCAKRRF